jgi:asparagine synthase (glutamine-hydrolysing)
MCGLFGVIRPTGVLSSDETTLSVLGDCLQHRGPDGSGYIRERQAILGMHRLSIMDPAHGWQPFWSEDQRWGVLGNGEIYNAGSLRHELTNAGHRIATRSDMEVIPHLLEENGTGAFLRLRGMFALVVFDRLRNEVLLVRDRLGEKPLCYWQGDGALFFASEQRALVRSGVVPLAIDQDQLVPYLIHGYTPEPQSLITAIHKVPAGHFLRVDVATGATTLNEYWNPLNEVSDRILTDRDIADALEDAIVTTCASDVPVGIALSGGLDSSLVASVAAKSRTDLKAFTVGYDSGGMDESQQARDLADYLGIPCHTAVLRTADIAREFAQVCGDRDEPISDIAGPAIASLPRAAQEAGVPVLLTGIGGDELFWGYDWMRSLAAWSTTYLEQSSSGMNVQSPRFTQPPRVLQAQVDWLTGLGGLRTDFDIRQFIKNWQFENSFPLPFYEFQPSYRDIYRGIASLGFASLKQKEPEFSGLKQFESMAAYYTIASNATYLRVNSFVQVDRLSMRYSIESRTPLADQNLVSTILSGRLASRDHFEPPKSRLRRIARDFLPEDIVNRPKRGFTPPVRDWLREIWKSNRDALDGQALVSLAGLPERPTRRLLASPTTRLGRINQLSLRLLTLELWMRSMD